MRNFKVRHGQESRFKLYGLVTVSLVVLILFTLFGGIAYQAHHAFTKTYIQTEDPNIISELLSDPLEHIGGQYFLANDEVDYAFKHKDTLKLPTHERMLNDQQILIVKELIAKNRIERKFNYNFFTKGDSRSPERAGILGAVMGSIFTLLITLIIAFPLGIATAIYLEEFAPNNRLIRFIELNITNLASIPSIIYGLLALSIFINLLHLPRSSALVGGMTLALMSLPTIIIASRTAMSSVPNMIRDAARGLGASPMQVVFHHIIPLAMPGIMTGTILSLARAIGESSALLLVGMVAFIVDPPTSPLDPASVLPVQIFNWARNPEQGFIENCAAAILVLLIILGIMNTVAVVLRRRYEHKW